MPTEHRERLTPEEARAVIRLWSRRQWERQHWPTVTDIAEGLDIPIAEAESLLREVQATGPPSPISRKAVAPFAFHLTFGVAGLTTFFSLFLSRLLG